jgi:predicted secreted protein
MNWFTGIVVYLLIWWTVLFAVLPIGTRPIEEADPEAGGWRGAPQRPLLGRKVIGTTVLATVLWLGVFALVESDWLSFREGWLAYQGPGVGSPGR